MGNAANSSNTFTISGGLADFQSDLGIGRDDATGLLIISGGTVNVTGALSFDVVNGGNSATDVADGTIDFTTGSTGELTVTGLTATDYEAFYTAGDLTFAGDNSAAFADVFEVSGNTLSLVVPEPSSTALLGLGGLALILRRRK